MKLCGAQIASKKGHILENIAHHKLAILFAAAEGADLIVFPELSVTGYEPDLAQLLASTQDDSRLDELQGLSDENQLIICLGLPIKTESLPMIGMVILSPNKPRQTYCKQHLHKDELPYFSPGKLDLKLNFAELQIAPAICYESLLEEHAQKAFESGANIYLASVAKPQRGIEKANVHMPSIAKKHNFNVLMANAVGASDNFISAGSTAAWDSHGQLLAKLGNAEEGLLLFDTVNQTVTINLL